MRLLQLSVPYKPASHNGRANNKKNWCKNDNEQDKQKARKEACIIIPKPSPHCTEYAVHIAKPYEGHISSERINRLVRTTMRTIVILRVNRFQALWTKRLSIRAEFIRILAFGFLGGFRVFIGVAKHNNILQLSKNPAKNLLITGGCGGAGNLLRLVLLKNSITLRLWIQTPGQEVRFGPTTVVANATILKCRKKSCRDYFCFSGNKRSSSLLSLGKHYVRYQAVFQ